MRSAIRSFDDLRDRCRMDDATGCWIWVGAMSRGIPSIYWPGSDDAPRGPRSPSIIIGLLKHGRAPQDGKHWHHICGNGACVNPAHRRLMTRSDIHRMEFGPRPAVTKARLSRARAAQSSRVTDAQCAEIRAHGGTLAEIAAMYGISQSSAWSIRSGRSRNHVGGASAFTWRPA